MDFIFDSSLVLYLPLSELDGASFRSKDAYGHLCTAGRSVWRFNGHYFDGTDDIVNCGTSSVLSPPLASGMVWIKADATPPNAWGVILARWDVTNGYAYHLTLGDGTTNNKSNIYIGTGAGIKAVPMVGTLTLAQWHSLGFTYDGTNLLLYVDGEIDNSDTHSQNLTTSTQLTGIGDTHTTPSSPFKGLIGEVWIYSRTLTPLEIQHNYLATKWRYR